jgi:hypothetical protein
VTPNQEGLSPQPSSLDIDHGVPSDNAYSGSINLVSRPAGAGRDIDDA